MEPHFAKDYKLLHQNASKNKEKIVNEEHLDSKGYRILTSQVPDFSRLTNEEVVNMLESRIVFNQYDIVALNKPYGLAVHGANADSDVQDASTSKVASKYSTNLNLSYFLPALAQRLACDKLYTVHRLDRDTTGVLLLTRTQEKAKLLADLFLRGEIRKKYLCITRGVPDDRAGIIDIPIALGSICGEGRNKEKRERMVLVPEALQQIKGHTSKVQRMAKRAVTEYKVLAEKGNAALMEVSFLCYILFFQPCILVGVSPNRCSPPNPRSSWLRFAHAHPW